MKQQVKNEQIKKKINLCLRFIGKPTGHTGYYMINMGGQKPKIGSN